MKNICFITGDDGELIDVTEKDCNLEMPEVTEEELSAWKKFVSKAKDWQLKFTTTEVVLNIKLTVDVNKDHKYFDVTNVVTEEIKKAYKRIEKRLK